MLSPQFILPSAVTRTSGKGAKHGYSYAAEYRAWQTMRLRCTEPTNPAYKDYGGRGIKVCERWLNSVEAFIEDMGPKPSPKHELDRYPDNNGNYEPGNCRWRLRKGWDMASALGTPVREKAPKGHAKPTKANACLECGKPSNGIRCQPCENRTRPRRANYRDQLPERMAA